MSRDFAQTQKLENLELFSGQTPSCFLPGKLPSFRKPLSSKFQTMVATAQSSVSSPSLLVGKLRSAQAADLALRERDEDDEMFAGFDASSTPSFDDALSFVEYVLEETSPQEQAFTSAVTSTIKAKLKKAKRMKGANRYGDKIRRINISKAKGAADVLRICIHQLGWKAIIDSQARFDLCWMGITGADTDVKVRDAIGTLQPKQLLSRLPGMALVAQKAKLHKQLHRAQTLCPEHFSHFAPKAWVLPKQRKELEQAIKTAKKKWFIAKPDGGSQGDGIFLFNKMADYDVSVRSVTSGEPDMVVEQYIERPLLIDGFKFDLRLYVLVTSVRPLRVHLCREGLARFCTVRYARPTTRNAKSVLMHLTNYSLNKYSNEFVHEGSIECGKDEGGKAEEGLEGQHEKERNEQEHSGEEEEEEEEIPLTEEEEEVASNTPSDTAGCGRGGDDGSKRAWTWVRQQLLHRGMASEGELEACWGKIGELVAKTMLAVMPELMHAHDQCTACCARRGHSRPTNADHAPPSAAPRGLQILGFDVLLDESFQPYLIEVNHNPSLSVDEELEVETAVEHSSAAQAPPPTIVPSSPSTPHMREWGAGRGSRKEQSPNAGTQKSSQSSRVRASVMAPTTKTVVTRQSAVDVHVKSVAITDALRLVYRQDTLCSTDGRQLMEAECNRESAGSVGGGTEENGEENGQENNAPDNMYDLVLDSSNVTDSVPRLATCTSGESDCSDDEEESAGDVGDLEDAVGLLEDARALFVRYAGQRDLGEMGSTNFGKCMRTIRSQLSAADADILFLKVTREAGKPRMGLQEFFDAMLQLATKASPDDAPMKALEVLMELFATD
jgi:hypothetical protein